MPKKRRATNDDPDPAAIATERSAAAAAERGAEAAARARVLASLGAREERLPGPITVRRTDGRVFVTAGADCHNLGDVQGSVLWQLVEAADRTFPWVKGSLLLERAGSRAGHLSHLFRSSSRRPLLRLILTNRGGIYRITPGRRVDGDTFEIEHAGP